MEIPKSKYCRICFKTQNIVLINMSEIIRENFLALTNIHLIKSETFSNLICNHCEKKISEHREFRDELIKNEMRLINSIEKNNFEVKIEVSSHEIFNESDSEPTSTQQPSPNRRKSTRRKAKKIEAEIENLPETQDGKINCPHCSKSIRKIYYHQHFERTHLGIKNFICDICGKNFYKWSSMESHMNQHLKIQPFNCPHNCGRMFFNRTSLRTHIKHNHNDEFRFVCEICAMRFKERYILQEHISTKHDGLRFKCTYPNCNLEYYSNSGLKKHIISTHHSRMEPCEICGVSFRSGCQMYQHKRLKHSAMKFACSHCDKRFATAALKKNHEKLHTGERNYICQICHSRYHIRRNLTRHIQVAHRKSKFYCKIAGCSAVLCNKDNFRTHVRKVHSAMPNEELEALLESIRTMKPDYIEGENEVSGEENV